MSLIISTRAYLRELVVEQHLFSQHRLVVEEMWLHVTPHVGKPPELFTVGQKQVISKILLICAWEIITHTHNW